MVEQNNAGRRAALKSLAALSCLAGPWAWPLAQSQFRVEISGVAATQVPITILKLRDEDKSPQSVSAIGRELERDGLNSVAKRAVVSTGRKLTVLARMLALLERDWAPAKKFGDQTAELEATRFLAAAVAAAPLRETAKPRVRPIEDRVVWVIDLFARLERSDQLQRMGSSR